MMSESLIKMVRILVTKVLVYLPLVSILELVNSQTIHQQGKLSNVYALQSTLGNFVKKMLMNAVQVSTT